MLDQPESVVEYLPAEIGRDTGPAATPLLKTFECFATEQQHCGNKEQEKRHANRDPGGRSSTERERDYPKKTAAHKDGDTGTREVQNQCGQQHGQTENAENPANPSGSKIILHARHQNDAGDAEYVGSLVAIRKRTETTLVNPERKR